MKEQITQGESTVTNRWFLKISLRLSQKSHLRLLAFSSFTLLRKDPLGLACDATSRSRGGVKAHCPSPTQPVILVKRGKGVDGGRENDAILFPNVTNWSIFDHFNLKFVKIFALCTIYMTTGIIF